MSPLAGGVAGFAIYWGLPFILAACDGTLLTPRQVAALTGGLSDHQHLYSLVPYLLGSQTMENGITYLTDRSHFVFSILLSLEIVVGAMILCRLNTAVDTLHREDILIEKPERVAKIYSNFQRLANHWIGRLLSAALATGTLFIFLHFYRDNDFRHWWGSSVHGKAGLLLSGIEFFMVYYGTQGAFLIGGASLMLAKILTKGVRLRPFHPDGCNGLGPVGTMIFLFWISALLIAAAVFVTMYLGYLGLERTQLAWVLAFLATVTVPLSAIIPLHGAVKAVLRARDKELKRLEPLLHDMFTRTVSSAQRGDDEGSLSLADRIGKLQEVYSLLADLNIWPFNPRALAIIMSAYGVQFLVTLHEFVGGFPGKFAGH